MAKKRIKNGQHLSRKRERISFYSPQTSLLEQTSTEDIMPWKLNSVSSSKWQNAGAVYVLNLESGYLWGHTHNPDLCSKARYTKTSSETLPVEHREDRKAAGKHFFISLCTSQVMSVYLKSLVVQYCYQHLECNTVGTASQSYVVCCIFAISQR